MENFKTLAVHVTLKGVNYLLWSRTVKSVLSGRGLWAHVEGEAPKKAVQSVEKGKEGEGSGAVVAAEGEQAKWYQDDQVALVILQSSLDPAIHEAYSYCESAKHLWDTLKKVYGNLSNLSRVYEVKKALSDLRQEDMEFTQWFGKYRSLWAELEMLRPPTVDPVVLAERLEQDKVFGLMLNLNPAYGDLNRHLLRQDKLPCLEEVCGFIQREQGNRNLLGGKGEPLLANKVTFRPEERKVLICDHCKRKGHSKDRCWLLHPHLKQNRWDGQKNRWDKSRANVAAEGVEVQANIATSSAQQADGKNLGAQHGDYVKKSDLAELIKSINALKESGISYHASNLSDCIIVDSGASHNMIKNPRLISNLKPALGNVVIADGKKVPIRGIGDLKLFDKSSKAFYMPTFTSNLLSVNKTVCDLNCKAIFDPNKVYFQDIKSGKILGEGVTRDGLYLLEDAGRNPILSLPISCLSSSDCSNENALWHARLGHPHSRALGLLLPSISFKNDDCEACILGKHCRSVFPKSSTIYEHCFDLVHSDVWTAPCESREHHKYFVTFIDEKSKYTWLTLLPSKDRVLEAFANFQNYVTNQYNGKIKILRTDNGGEYTSHAFKQHLAKHGIVHQTTCPYTPQQNGVSERKNRHLMEVARSMMFHTNVPKKFWSDAVTSACYLINRTPTRVLLDKSPFEVLTQTKPSIDHLRVFGCVCFVLVPGEQRNKLEAKSTKGMFIGYSTTQKGYKCYVPETRRVLVSREVKFVETSGFYDHKDWEGLKDISQSSQDRATTLRGLLEKFGIGNSSDNSSNARSSCETEGGNDDAPNTTCPSMEQGAIRMDDGSNAEATPHPDELNNTNEEVLVSDDLNAAPETDVNEDNGQVEPTTSAPIVLRRSQRVRKDPSNWVNTRVYYNNQAVAHPTQAMCSFAQLPPEHQAFVSKIDQHFVPNSYEEAKEHKVWRDAVDAEHGAMERNHTWDESELPKGKKAVTSKWIFTIKYKSDGEIERYKARLVARGFTQTYGEDFSDTFAPVAKLHTVRVVLSLATNLDWDLWQMDVKNAFLQGELDEEVYMVPPPGLESIVAPGNVLRLRKAIYGLKQSPRAWYHKLSHTLRDQGFRRSEADHTLFTLQSKEGIVVILIYVDDIIITGSNKGGIQGIKDHLKSVFDIKDLGEMKYFLGIEIYRSQEGLFLSQRKYTLDLLSEAGTLGARAAKTPLDEAYQATRKGEKNEDDQPFEDAQKYRRMVGKLIYLTITRPDLCFAVNQVSQHMQSPKQRHWEMVDRILRYLKAAPGQGIWMGRNESTELVGYCDADWAGDRQDRKSTTGYCTFLGGNLVTWKTKKQKVVSCSSAEAEYRAMKKLANELTWLKALLKDLGIESQEPITMHCDNQAAIHIASNSVFHERTKHIEIDCHKVREKIEQGVVLPCYTRSSDQLADIFTKGASLKVCELVYPKLGLINISRQ